MAQLALQNLVISDLTICAILVFLDPLGAFQRHLRPRRVDGGLHTARGAGRGVQPSTRRDRSCLSARPGGRYKSIAAGDDSTPLRSEIKL